MNTECHLYTLPQTESDDNNDTSSDESDLEVISIVDETDNIAISIKNHFNLDDDEEDNNNEGATDIPQSNSVLNSNDTELDEDLNDTELDEDLNDLNADIVSTDQSSLLASSSAVSNSVEEHPSCKRKRRQWSTAEKLHAVDMLEKAGGNKLLTSKKEGCSRYQLSQWMKQKEDLIQLSKQNHGRKRKRLPGAGHKLQYPELDKLLLEWFRERRTAPAIQSNVSTMTTSIVVKREKVTFKQLQRRGKQLCIELKHEHPPSTKWRANTWGPKRGVMGAFLPRDVVNMDESPLSLFGDQTKLSINDVNTVLKIKFLSFLSMTITQFSMQRIFILFWLLAFNVNVSLSFKGRLYAIDQSSSTAAFVQISNNSTDYDRLLNLRRASISGPATAMKTIDNQNYVVTYHISDSFGVPHYYILTIDVQNTMKLKSNFTITGRGSGSFWQIADDEKQIVGIRESMQAGASLELAKIDRTTGQVETHGLYPYGSYSLVMAFARERRLYYNIIESNIFCAINVDTGSLDIKMLVPNGYSIYALIYDSQTDRLISLVYSSKVVKKAWFLATINIDKHSSSMTFERIGQSSIPMEDEYSWSTTYTLALKERQWLIQYMFYEDFSNETKEQVKYIDNDSQNQIRNPEMGFLFKMKQTEFILTDFLFKLGIITFICRTDSGQTYPCQEIYFKKNTDIPLRLFEVRRTNWRVIQVTIDFTVISIGKPDDKYFNSIPKQWSLTCLDINLGVLFYPQTIKINLEESTKVQVWLRTPPHRINGNDTLTIQWKPMNFTDSFEWTPKEFIFNTKSFQERQILTITRIKDTEQTMLIPVFYGGGFDLVSPQSYPIYIQ
ncbi:unnamed protein product [Rotaria sordida]|uniref:Uncharacterized protein n=1 Tax=Rotaria sordida TaxID=392033 RepID=A0A819PZC7_9BILA|nr:unnamed protein product [Rotaria sordida]